jgi:hypothetical protein
LGIFKIDCRTESASTDDIMVAYILNPPPKPLPLAPVTERSRSERERGLGDRAIGIYGHDLVIRYNFALTPPDPL